MKKQNSQKNNRRRGGSRSPWNESLPKDNRRNSAMREKVSGRLAEIFVEGFKSLRKVNLRLEPINILIGANGAGKSNALGFFEMLSYMMSGSLQEYVTRKGGGDDLLFNGAKQTQSMWAQLSFASSSDTDNVGKNEYQFRLSHTEGNALAFGEERYRFTRAEESTGDWRSLGQGHWEAQITDHALRKSAHITKRMMQNCSVYQFHDTSKESSLKIGWDAEDVRYLKDHGGNLPSVLWDLQENYRDNYNEIVRHIRELLPVFKDFEPQVLYGKARLRWKSRSDTDKTFGAHLTSDGTLRLMALVTLLCMPASRQPDVILLDEPELGLHPEAIAFVAALIKRAATQKQIIVATQSPLLLNEFAIDDIVVAEMDAEGGTEFNRLEEKNFLQWLDEFKAGDLWQKNLIGGNP